MLVIRSEMGYPPGVDYCTDVTVGTRGLLNGKRSVAQQEKGCRKHRVQALLRLIRYHHFENASLH
eukprot:scaffold18347_cov55-Attheya_sp.AAC.1